MLIVQVLFDPCLSIAPPLVMQHGACVNAMDLWQFTPLHEAASKNRVDVCSLLVSYGADPTFLNCHNQSAIDLSPTSQLKERLACKPCIFFPLFHCSYSL